MCDLTRVLSLSEVPCLSSVGFAVINLDILMAALLTYVVRLLSKISRRKRGGNTIISTLGWMDFLISSFEYCLDSQFVDRSGAANL